MTEAKNKNKILMLLTGIILLTWQINCTAGNIAHSFIAEWKALNFSPATRSPKQAKLFQGKTLDLASLDIKAHVLAAGNAGTARAQPENEELIIVYRGQLQIENAKGKARLGPGSVILSLPDETRKLSNPGQSETSYYTFSYKTHKGSNRTRGLRAGGGLQINWNDVEYLPSDIGGRRNFFERPTAMFDTFEMHVSTLNGGLTNHPAHTHRAEEFVLIMEGKVEMLLGDKTVQAQAGDLIYLESMIPHSLNNIGEDATTYFAFQFWQ